MVQSKQLKMSRCRAGNTPGLYTDKAVQRVRRISCGVVAPRPIDVSGQRFGRLSVLCRAGQKGGKATWICACDCGVETIVSGDKLRQGETKSCGCLKREAGSRKRIDLTGRRFGRLVVAGYKGADAKGKSIYYCVCDCGSIKSLAYATLQYGLCVSCGCYRNEISANNGRASAHKHSGEKSHLYKPGLTDQDRVAKRNLVQAREWRGQVFKRDDYRCDLCSVRGGFLQAHHLNNWADHPAERFDVSNGITLCQAHHRDFHRAVGIRNQCTAQDYKKFKAVFYIMREARKLEQPEAGEPR